MNFLLTGATGFLGRRLATMLLDGGDSVHYLGRKRSDMVDSRANFHEWGRPERDVAPLDQVPEFQAVIHLAGEPVAQRWTAEVKRKIRESRIDATRHLVDGLSARQQKPPVMVSASAVGYYGDRGDQVLTEQSGVGQGFLAEVCSAWEHEASRAASVGLRVAIVRIGVVLGPDGGALAQMLPTFRAGLGARFGSGRQWISWIHRDDLLDMMIWAARTASVRGVLNGTAPEPVTNRELTRTLGASLHRPAILSAPRFALKIALGEMADSLFDSTRAMPQAALQHGFTFRYHRLDAALSHILRKPSNVLN